MNYYFIYSAGGGAGDWNGVKRVWLNSMNESLKKHILLKFGDIFFEHATGRDIYRPVRWNEITNLRNWLFSATNDNYVLTDSDILLDSGTAKAVTWIHHNNNHLSCNELIDMFDRIFDEKCIFEKYESIINESNINSAVTFDIPNPFKVRSQSENTRLNILDRDSSEKLIETSARYANKLHSELSSILLTRNVDDILMTIINGTWTQQEIDLFLSKLTYSPTKIAIGGLSAINSMPVFRQHINTLNHFNLFQYDKIHFLGCGGIQKVSVLKNLGYITPKFSVDSSTVINRTIDGNIAGTSQSCYYVYNTMQQIRIKPETRNLILNLHQESSDTYYTIEEMTDIIDLILLHQSNHSSDDTYDARAKLMFHNADTYRRHASN